MKKRTVLIYIILILLLALLVIININAGSVRLSLAEIFKILFLKKGEMVNSTILLNIRIPRIIVAIFLGGGLALSGYLLQAFFSNPIAGPFVLGISSGAKFIVAILMVISCQYAFSLNSFSLIVAAFIGAMIATLFVIVMANKVKNMSILIVCGVMTGYICSAATELIVSFADDSNIVNLHNWSMGTFSSVSWKEVYVIIPVIIFGLIVSIFLSKNIEAYAYGEDYASSVGINVKNFRLLLILVSSLLSATVTAFAGPISFVGIAVPHVIRNLFKTSKPFIIITGSFLGGAVFCLFCDLLARNLFAPVELSISTITAIFGAPVVISMLLSRKRG